MLSKLKTELYETIKQLGYNITDNATYVENFPWLMLRTNGYQILDSFNMKIGKATLVLDIFSQYNGEKEIIEIADDIQRNLATLIDNNSDVLYGYQKDLKILDDKKTGPVRKHGVVIYEFLLGYGIEQEELNDN